MTRFRIKVCGLTRPSDARLAASLGADMIGLIFYRRSPRYVSLSRAREIVAAIPPTVAPTGVFVDTPAERICAVARNVRLAFVQLHGDYSVADERWIRKQGLRTIRVIRVPGKSGSISIRPGLSDLIMLDHSTDDAAGGTGARFDWSLRLPRKIPNLMLAGGVNADNVAEGIARFRPLVIDVNSGVESRPGVKSAARLRRFFEVCNKLRYGS